MNPALIFWITAAIFVLLFCLVSLFRGWKTALIRFGTLLLSAVGAYFLAPPLARLLGGGLISTGLLVAGKEGLFASVPQEIAAFLKGILSALTAPVFFLLLFLLFAFLTLLVCLAVFRRLEPKDKPMPAVSRIAGTLIGLFSACFFVAAVALPLYGYGVMARSVLEKSDLPAEEKSFTVLGEKGDGAMDALGAYSLFSGMTEVDAAGETVCLADETETSLVGTLLFETEGLVKKDPKTWDKEDAAVIREIAEKMSGSALGRAVGLLAAESIRSAREGGESWLGVDFPADGEDGNVLSGAILSLIETADSQTVADLYLSVGNTLALFAEKGYMTLFSENGSPEALLDDPETLGALIDTVFASRSLDELSAAAAGTVIDSVLSSLGLGEEISGLDFPDGSALSAATPEEREREKAALVETAKDAAALRQLNVLDGDFDPVADKDVILTCARILDRVNGTILFGKAADSLVEQLADRCVEAGLLSSEKAETVLRRYREAATGGDFKLERLLDLAITAFGDLRALGADLSPDQIPDPDAYPEPLSSTLRELREMLSASES
ncbi:MAG: hypothetical protein IJR89_05120 [Clostridia bacterium]|nr:hypothetical protein [Clostridia bacterium]